MQLLQELYRILHAGLTQDRIRAAPGIGKLLCLEAGSRLLIRQAMYQIIERTETTDSATLLVTYHLAEIEQEVPAQLSVAIDLTRPTSGLLKLAQHSSTMEIFYRDVTVLGPMHRTT